jgi:outer membrane receptor protein involved in Fe transport
LGNVDVKTTVGIGLRDDQISNIGLAHTKNRNFLNDFTKGDIHETNFNAYMNETFYFSNRFSLNLGVRFDNFHFSYRNKLSDTTNDVSSALKSIVSPKLNLFYNATSNIQFYFSAGSGFHSNDARVAVANPGNILPRAISSDLGTNLKISKKLFVNAALWAMDLESEYVWVGDEGLFEPSGRTRRVGIDLSARYQILPWLYADGDLNVANPKYLDEPEGQNYVPLAPPITSIAGLNVKTKNGITGSLRYRYLGARPAVEDNSIVAVDYFIMDAVFGFTHKNYQIGFMAENLLNEYWKETQFATTSRLKGESEAVNEIHYTPGIPFNLRANFTLFF